MKKLFLLFFLLYLVSYGQSDRSKWTSSMYEQYNSNDFSKLEAANAKINFDNIDYKLFSASIFYATNIQRKKYKRREFKYSVALNSAAQAHSEDMVNKKFLSHKSRIRHKRKLKDRMKIVRITKGIYSENIANIYSREEKPTYWSFALQIVETWMNSKGHRENILDTRLKYLGCGVRHYINKKWTDYNWVKTTQNFSSYSPKP